MKPFPAGLVTVTLSTTADAPVAGTPAAPVIWTEMEPLPGTGPAAPNPPRVSSTRAGFNETNEPGTAAGTADTTDAVAGSVCVRAPTPAEVPIPQPKQSKLLTVRITKRRMMTHPRAQGTPNA